MSKMRLADYVACHLADYGVRHVFMVTGGGAMFLNDAIGREKRLNYICNHHEQASAMAAESYARLTNRLGVINVTTGPGGINALNGVFGAWTDSIPMLIVSGQVKRETCMASYDLPHLRQLGDQEANVVGMARGITKYAVLVQDPQTIRYHLEKAIYLATTGRPGPCWLDVPVDVQSSLVDPDALLGYDPRDEETALNADDLEAQCREIVERLRRAERPVLLLGSGVRLAGAEAILETVIRKLGVPVTTAWTAHDLMDSDDLLYCGRPGSVGNRPGNFTLQNADLALIIGCRLALRQISYNWPNFAQHAFKIQVDVDPAELQKPTVRPDMSVPADARQFLETLDRQIDQQGSDPDRHAVWLAWCKERLGRYPVVQEHQQSRCDSCLNPYHFLDVLYRKLNDDDVVVCGDGAACVVTFQVAHIKKGQRLYTNAGCASMGYDLPAAVGAAVARAGKRVICLAGDGSVQMNVQELQTVAHHRLPIKVFVLNNGGYLSIRSTQLNFFQGNLVGEGPRSGVSFPDMVKLATAYGLEAVRIESAANFGATLDEVLNRPGPVICEVMLDPSQGFEPKLSSRQLPDGKIVSASLEDMAPFLEREELRENMLAALPG